MNGGSGTLWLRTARRTSLSNPPPRTGNAQSPAGSRSERSQESRGISEAATPGSRDPRATQLPDLALGRVFRRDAQAGAAFHRLSRCEMMLQRGFHRSWNALQQRQALRKTKNAERTYQQPEMAQNQSNAIPP